MGSSGGGFQALEVLATLAFQSQDAFCTTVGLSAPCWALFIRILDQAIAFFLLEQLASCQQVGGREVGTKAAQVCLSSSLCYSLFPCLLCALFLKTTGTQKLPEPQEMAQDTAEGVLSSPCTGAMGRAKGSDQRNSGGHGHGAGTVLRQPQGL